MRVADVMSKELRAVAPDVPVAELEHMLLAEGVSGFPVVEGDRLVGVVSRSDIVRMAEVERTRDEQISDYQRLTVTPPAGDDANVSSSITGARVGARLESMKVSDVMVRSVITCPPDESVQQAARLLLNRDIHRAPVVESGRLVGILTSMDFVRLVANGH